MSPRKPRLQISLRLFFLLFTCVSIAVALFAHYARQRWAAFAAIRQAGGNVRMGIGEPALLEKWFGAELFGTVNNVDLRKGKWHPKLKKLDVYSTEVDDSGVADLVACESLIDVGLSMTKITDAVFQHLDQLPNLTDADLTANAPVTTEAVLRFEKSHPKCDVEWWCRK